MKIKTRDMILISTFAALTAIGAFIKIPTPMVPFTLQFIFCAYAGMFLGSRHGLYSQLLYVGIGLAGIPIFANGGGLTYIFQPTFGYLLGFMGCSYIVGKFTENQKQISFKSVLPAVIAGLAFVYLVGVSYLYMIVNLYMGKAMSVQAAIAAGFLPYITTDLLQSLLIAATSVYVIPALRRAGYARAS